MSENLNICNKKLFDRLAPTPQNTPATNSLLQTSVSSVSSGTGVKSEELSASNEGALSKGSGLASMIQDRLESLVGASSGYIESLPEAVRRRVEGLQGLQAEYSKLEMKLQDEILFLEKKYHDLCAPLYSRRAGIVNGTIEPNDTEIEAGRKFGRSYNSVEKPDAENVCLVSKDIKGIPQFWLTAMKNIPSLAEIITPEDEKALVYLTDIRLSYLDKPGFRLEFYFADNEFFSNKVINKTYCYRNELGYGGDFVYDHAEGDKIDWKNNKDLTTKLEIKKQRNKNTKQMRVVKKVVPVDSFFRFFMPPIFSDDQDDDSDIDNRLEADYQYGEDIKEKLIPRAIDWFTGLALAYEDEYVDDSDQDYTDDLNDDDDDDDDDNDDDDDHDDDHDNNNRFQEKDSDKLKQDPSECRQS